MSYVYWVQVEGRAPVMFDAANDAMKHARNYVYLDWERALDGVELLKRGVVYSYCYGFSGVDIIPEKKLEK